MQYKKGAIAISRGKFLRIGLAYYDEIKKIAHYTSFYDNYDFENLIKLLKNCDEILIEDSDFIKFLKNEKLHFQIIKLKNKIENENIDFYASIALSILSENEDVDSYTEFTISHLRIYYNIDILNLFHSALIEKNIKFNKKFNYEVLILQPLSSIEEIERRREIINYYKSQKEIEENITYENSIMHEKNIYAFFIKFMQIYKIVIKIKLLNFKYYGDFEEILLPDYIDLEKINEYKTYYIFKKNKIPFLDRLIEISESYTEKLNQLKEKYKCEYKIADEIFFIENKKENFSKYFFDEKIIIKEYSNKIIFSTKEIQEISLKLRIIKDQSEELIIAFLNDNKFTIPPSTLRKIIYNINKIQEIILLIKISSGQPIEFSNKMIYSGPPAIYTCSQIPFNILYGNNMSGKSTYLQNIMEKILFAQLCGFSTNKIAKQPIFKKLFFLREYNIFDKKNPTVYSAFEWELKKIKILIENVDEHSLVLIDEIGKSGTYEEGLSIAILISKILFSKNCFSYFATHFSTLHTHLKKYEEEKKFFNIIQATVKPFDIKSGIPIYKSIASKIIPELEFKYENQSTDCDINEIQFAIQLNN